MQSTDSAPLIGLTTYAINEDERYNLPRHYSDAIRRAGGLPVLLPPGEPHWRQLAKRLDGLILTGGGDIDPWRYDGFLHDEIYMVDRERDDSEFALCRYAIEFQLPTLAICRGMQVLNIVLGGSLHEHLEDHFGFEVNHRVPPRESIPHEVSVNTDSRLAEILGEISFNCMSWHHQAVKKMAPEFYPAAQAADGCIEAMESEHYPWLLAVQWHPELTAATDPIQQRLFDEIVKYAKVKKS